MSFIKHYVQYSTESSINSENKPIERQKSLVLRYPCTNTSTCEPYKLTINPGVYKMECWGSIGVQWGSVSRPGLGAYAKGTILIPKMTTMFVYVGAKGFFNSVRNTLYAPSSYSGGGATDVRLEKGETWYTKSSLISRIIVAAGGGGAEWASSFGGNGGTLVGGTGISAQTDWGSEQYSELCEGPTQTSGSECPSYTYSDYVYNSYTGEFGSAGFVPSKSDYGGFGGGGYYGGSSYFMSFAGSGGSSFISGHEGCNSVKNSLPVEHTGTPYHYSGFIFTETEMIGGNETMPLPTGGKGIFDDSRGGAFRITVVSFYNISCKCSSRSLLSLLSITLITLCS